MSTEPNNRINYRKDSPMSNKKFDKPLNLDNYPKLPIIVIEKFARFPTTTQVLDFLEYILNIYKRSFG